MRIQNKDTTTKMIKSRTANNCGFFSATRKLNKNVSKKDLSKKSTTGYTVVYNEVIGNFKI